MERIVSESKCNINIEKILEKHIDKIHWANLSMNSNGISIRESDENDNDIEELGENYQFYLRLNILLTLLSYHHLNFY